MAFGCSCMSSSPCSAYTMADAVVMVKNGRVLEVDRGFVTKAEGEITALWKGDIQPGRQVTVHASPNCNVAKLAPGESLLYYGPGLFAGNQLYAIGCTRKAPLEYAGSDLRYLASVKAASTLPLPLAKMQERWAAFQECFARPLVDHWWRR